MSSKCNVGGVDRTVRIVLGMLIIALGVSSGSLWGLLGVVLLLTGVFKWCGLYTVLGVSTCKVEAPEGEDVPKENEG
jgi:uncharacterized membrane protein